MIVTLSLALVVLALNLGLFWLPAAPLLGAAELELARVGAEPWRLFTGHLAHVSPAHLWLDLLGLVLLGGMVERRHGGRRLLGLLLVAAPVIGLALIGRPGGIEIYRGLSGLNHALFFVVLCSREDRWATLLGLVFGFGVVAELVLGVSPIGSHDVLRYGAPVPLAHAAGALCGVVAGAVARCVRTARNRNARCGVRGEPSRQHPLRTSPALFGLMTGGYTARRWIRPSTAARWNAATGSTPPMQSPRRAACRLRGGCGPPSS